jgi:hypothetical protein
MRIIVNKINKKIRKIKSWFIKRAYAKKTFTESKKLILFFFPTEVDSISGGVLSICAIFNIVKELEPLHKSNVVASFLPKIKGKDCTYSQFENSIVVFNLSEIMDEFRDLESLEIHIPDIYINLFTENNKKYNSFYKWMKRIPEVKINFLNQNDMLMPDLHYIDQIRKITHNLTMTVAHEKYASQEKRNYYGVPIHLFSPWTTPSPFVITPFEQKENYIILSPDLIDKDLYKTDIGREDVINKLKLELPHYQLVTIQNMKYNDYRKIISRAKFALTFGEGLDAYFGEPIFSGSVSFAVYNEVFFTEQFKHLPTVYESFEVLLRKIVEDIKYYDDKVAYEQYQQVQIQILNKIYSLERLQDNIKQYYLGNFDFK